LRIAFLGAGSIAERHIDAIRGTRAGDVTVVASRTEDKVRSFAEKKSIPHCTTDALEALGDPDVDTVVIAYPTFLHADLAIAALQAGKHVVVEKPIAETVSQAESMIAAARTARRQLLVCQLRRFWPSYATIHRAIQSGTFGRIHRMSFDFQAWWNWANRGWRIERPGGYFLDMHVHEVDLLSWWAGASPDGVTAVGTNVAEGDGVVALQFEHATGVLTYSGRCYGKTYPAGSTSRAQVEGDLGLAELVLENGTVRLNTTTSDGVRKEERTIAEETRTCWSRMWTALADTIERGAPPPLTPEEATASLRTTLCAVQSFENRGASHLADRRVLYSGRTWT